jgi:chromosome segregation ATPase
MKTRLTALLLCLLASSPLHAEEKADPTARMREAMRGMALQLRNIQTERDNLAVKQAEAEQKQKELETQIKTLTKNAADDKVTIDSLKARLSEQEARTAQTAQELEKWKAACNKAEELAKTKESERAKLAERVILLDRIVADQKTKNAEMFKVGNEILTRYEKFGLGTAITAREPFTGLTRVKLQNLVQDYSDKLGEQRIKPEAAKAN